MERFGGHGPSLPAPEHDEGALSEADDGRELAYFGRVGQMMGDFRPQNAFRAWIGG